MSPLDREPVPGSVGLPFPSRKTMIVDPATLEPVAPGEAGELLVTSEFISKAYWNKPDETAAAYVEIDGAIWYRMNDYVRMDSDGQLFYVDRSADVIKHKGYRVSCSEIEAILQDHQAVMGACVVGVPDSKVGERINPSSWLAKNYSVKAACCRMRDAHFVTTSFLAILKRWS